MSSTPTTAVESSKKATTDAPVTTTLRGHLPKERFGPAVPVNAPLYPRPPFQFTDITFLQLRYRTNGEAAARVLPEVLEIEPEPVCALTFVQYTGSPVGPYREVIQAIECRFDNGNHLYTPHMLVTTDAAMATGRELQGFPKRIGHIDWEPDAWTDDAYYCGRLERPRGVEIVSATFRPERRIEVRYPFELPFLTLRTIPSPHKDEPPSLLEIVKTPFNALGGEAWSGTGSFQYSGISVADPLHDLPLVEMLDAQLVRRAEWEYPGLGTRYPL